MTLVEFLLARIAEDEETASRASRAIGDGEWLRGNGRVVSVTLTPVATSVVDDHVARFDPARVLVECEAKRRIVEFHRDWPVLVATPPRFDPAPSDDVTAMTFRASQQVAWLTEQEYRARFGDEPPTAPMLQALATVYAGHPDYDESWRPEP